MTAAFAHVFVAPPLHSAALAAVTAHAAWFVTGHHPVDWSFTLQPLSLAYLAAALVVTVWVRLAAAVRIRGRTVGEGIAVTWLARLVPYMPFCVRIHMGAALVMLTSMGMYLTPALPLRHDPMSAFLGALMVVIGMLMAIGWLARPAACLLIASVPLAMLEFGLVPVLIGSVLFVALAVYVFLVGAGRWSADWELGHRSEPSVEDLARGLWALRVGAGLVLVIAAFTEKLAVPGASLAFLQHHPDFNFVALAGLPIGSVEFVRLMGGMEVLLGLLLISGAMPQPLVLFEAFPFVTTLVILGSVELAGHLGAHAILIALLVYASDPGLRAITWNLWPWSLRTVWRAPRRLLAPQPVRR